MATLRVAKQPNGLPVIIRPPLLRQEAAGCGKGFIIIMAVIAKGPPEGPCTIIHAEQCKGCGRCIAACPQGVLAFLDKRNSHGYRVAGVINDSKCVRCGLCFYSCPEPGGITVVRPAREKNK